MYKILASCGQKDFIIEHDGKIKRVHLTEMYFAGRGVPKEINKNDIRKLLKHGFQRHNPPDEVRDTHELEEILRLFPKISTPEDYCKAIALFREGKAEAELSEWDELWNTRELFAKE